MAEPDPIITNIHGAMEAHRRFLVYMVGEIERQRAARGGEAVDNSDAANQAIEMERLFIEYVLCSMDAQSKAVFAMIEEFKNDRFLTSALVTALSKQEHCDRKKLQADFLDAAAKLHGGAAKIPPHALDVSWMALGQEPPSH